MKSIIERLDIIPIRAVPMFKGQSDCDICSAVDVREKEKIFNEMLESLISLVYGPCGEDMNIKTAYAINIICKATDKTWEEVKAIAGKQ